VEPESAFSYSCRRCGRCCVDKRIQVNPYEVARLARGRGQGTAAFREAFTLDGSSLRQRDDGACVFFDPVAGCTVHADRPLVCRLFPLGRHISETGTVTYSHGHFDPPPGGDYGEDGTIGDFLEDQGAYPFITFVDAYFRWYLKASRADAEARPCTQAPSDLLDIDTVLSAHAARTGEAEPVTVEDRATLHLRILDDLIVITPEA